MSLKKKLRNWIVEILLSIFLIVLLVWQLTPPDFRSSLVNIVNNSFNSIGELINRFGNFISQPQSILLIVILVVTIAILIYRIRYHIERLAIVDRTCPSCGSSNLKKRHRKLIHRFLSLFIHVNRYHCDNCGWNGMRIVPKPKRKKKKSVMIKSASRQKQNCHASLKILSE